MQTSFPIRKDLLSQKLEEIARLVEIKRAFLILYQDKAPVFKLVRGIHLQGIEDLPPDIRLFSKTLWSGWQLFWGFEGSSPILPLLFENLVSFLEGEIIKSKLHELTLCCETVNNAIPQAVTIHDDKMRILKANQAAEKFLGLSSSQIIGRYCFEIFHGSNSPPSNCPALRLFRGEYQSEQEMRLESRGRIVQINVSSLLDENKKLKGFVHVVSDLTERRELEEKLVLAQKLEALGTLAGGIAHDFNNLLTPILGFAEVALLKSQEPKIKGYLKNIISCVKKAKELISQIQIFSHQGSLSREPLLIESLVKEATKLISAVLPKNIKIKTDIQSCGYILGNPTEIQQILLNLASNAFYAMRDRGGILEISLRSVSEEGKPFALLKVRDTGEGIPSEIMPRIFDPYFTTKPVKEGTGLGLAVVHGIVKKAGGFIRVKSKVGSGTTFEIYFPLVESPQKERKTFPQMFAEEPGSGEQILLLEDDEQNLKAISEALTLLGYQVKAFSTCEEALSKFFNSPQSYDLAILDLLFPGGSGDQVARILKEIRPDLPIILLTGFKDKIQPGTFEKILYKPVSLNELAGVIKEILSVQKAAGKSSAS